MEYADEEFYMTEYLSGRKPAISSGFSFYAYQASRTIDLYTFGRLRQKDISEIPEEVKMCCCELSEAGYRREKQLKDIGGKTSEKIGTYSVSYGTAQDISSAFAVEQRNIVMKWLATTGLCYRGVRHVYKC